ncbi:DUF6232 family protein [Chachezhania sediminis]|uniref:DUF6232 family protein n=1 Tax=Chachezhania sediminis TaxID=2599291 RepID=UPI00131BFD43|nr:DUF6232 family protein [Chachezhania sediminis]
MSEQPIYSAGGITVTARTVVMDEGETALAEVAEVSVSRKRFDIVWTVVLAVMLVLLALHAKTVLSTEADLINPAADLAILMGGVVIALVVASRVVMRPYTLVVVTRNGDHKAHIGKDPVELENAKAAIEGAKSALA